MHRRESVSIVVISWNRRKDMEVCLRSVFDQTKKPVDVTVVDNGSTDGTLEMIEQKFPKARLVKLHKNLGLCPAVNIGFAHARGDIVALVESDTVLSKNWVETLSREFRRAPPHVVLITPQVLSQSPEGYRDIEPKPNSQGYLLMPNGMFGVDAKVFREKWGGIYDDDYYVYVQDLELANRIYANGYVMTRTFDCATFHNLNWYVGRTPSNIILRMQMRNNYWNLFQYYSKRNIAVFVPIYLAYFFSTMWKKPGLYLSTLAEVIATLPKSLAKRKPVRHVREFESVRANFAAMRESMTRLSRPREFFPVVCKTVEDYNRAIGRKGSRKGSRK